jgi:hypothetical protein
MMALLQGLPCKQGTVNGGLGKMAQQEGAQGKHGTVKGSPAMSTWFAGGARQAWQCIEGHQGNVGMSEAVI